MRKSKLPSSTKAPKIPPLRKNGKFAYVTWEGKRIYLGRHGIPETEQAYREWLADFVRNGYSPPLIEAKGEEVTVRVLCAHFLQRHQMQTYSSTHQSLLESVIRTLNQAYGGIPAEKFGTLKLAVMRDMWIEGCHADPPMPLLRREVSRRLSVIKQIFKHGVAAELIPVEYYQRLCCLEPLQAGRTPARETARVMPVSQEHVDATIPHLTKSLQAAVMVQLLTGARSGEVLNLCPGDIDRTGEVWTANLSEHKTRHWGKDRILYFGKRAQAILKPLMLREADAYLFDPREAIRHKWAACPTHRRPNQKPNERLTDRTLNDHYTSWSYGRAVQRACDMAGVPRWHPHQLRHSAATLIRKEFGLEAARAILGHSTSLITETYAEMDRSKAIEVIAKIG